MAVLGINDMTSIRNKAPSTSQSQPAPREEVKMMERMQRAPLPQEAPRPVRHLAICLLVQEEE